MRYLKLSEILELHRRIIASSGGADGIRDLGALKSAVAQPRMTFDGADLYASVQSKAAALCHSLVCNHPFVDGNKRIGHAAAETMLMLNGYQIVASVDEQEELFLSLAADMVSREDLAIWFESNSKAINNFA